MNAIKWISARAKTLQARNKKLSWKNAIAEASKLYRAQKKPVRKVGERHTDTKSHNVSIRVVSGTGKKVGNVSAQDFTQVRNDPSGNPRYVIHYSNLLHDQERNLPLNQRFDVAVSKAKKIGGRKYTGKDYGGGIVFSTYNLADLAERINRIAATVGAVLLLERGESARKKPDRIYQVNRTRSGTFKKFNRLAGGLPAFQDPDTAQDILLTADSDSGLYFRIRQPIERSLFKKFKKGTFDLAASERLWRKYVDAADKDYARKYANKKTGYLLSVGDRKLLAAQKAREYKQELDFGNEFN